MEATNILRDTLTTLFDDVMCYSKEPEKIIEYLEKSYTMKGVGYPQFYLGGDVVDLPPIWKDHNVSFGLSYINYILLKVVAALQMKSVILHAPATTSRLATPAAIQDGLLLLFLLLVIEGVSKECIYLFWFKGCRWEILDTHLFAVLSGIKSFGGYACRSVCLGNFHFVGCLYVFVFYWFV